MREHDQRIRRLVLRDGTLERRLARTNANATVLTESKQRLLRAPKIVSQLRRYRPVPRGTLASPALARGHGQTAVGNGVRRLKWAPTCTSTARINAGWSSHAMRPACTIVASLRHARTRATAPLAKEMPTDEERQGGRRGASSAAIDLDEAKLVARSTGRGSSRSRGRNPPASTAPNAPTKQIERLKGGSVERLQLTMSGTGKPRSAATART